MMAPIDVIATAKERVQAIQASLGIGKGNLDDAHAALDTIINDPLHTHPAAEMVAATQATRDAILKAEAALEALERCQERLSGGNGRNPVPERPLGERDRYEEIRIRPPVSA